MIFGLFIHSVIGMPEKGREVIDFGFFISGWGASAYMFVNSASIGFRISACGFSILLLALFLINVAGTSHRITEILGDIGVWVMGAGVVIHGISVMRMTKK